MHCANNSVIDPDFIQIGYPSLINLRKDWPVPVAPRGVLGDYIPFYFTVRSPMLYVINKGNEIGVVGDQDEIIYLVSTVEHVEKMSIPFVFTDRNAKLLYAKFYNGSSEMNSLNWPAIRTVEWGRQYGEEAKELKQSEFLVHDQFPVNGLIGIGCPNEKVLLAVNNMLSASGVTLPVKVKPKWYY